MSMHKKILTEMEKTGLEKYKLPVGRPSQLSDCFLIGIDHARDEIRKKILQAMYDAECDDKDALIDGLYSLIKSL